MRKGIEEILESGIRTDPLDNMTTAKISLEFMLSSYDLFGGSQADPSF